MSYSRWLNTDVYVFAHTSGGFCCCSCDFETKGEFRCATPGEMAEHLKRHVAARHHVAELAIEKLEWEQEAGPAFYGSQG